MELSVTDIIEDVKQKICDDYCKFPDECLAKYSDLDIADDELYRQYCENCPLNRL